MPNEAANLVEAKAACVRFGDLHALGPIDLIVHAGECIVLLGPSGCGKSTLLAALAGLQACASGSVSIIDPERPPGVVFQEPNLMNWANARDNVALPLALARASVQEQAVKADAALLTVGLKDFATAYPRTLSGGMRMRVALARALVTEPRVLLLDEPFAAIDELGRRALDDLVLTAKHARDLAVLFVTHSVEEAVYLADRIIVLSPRPGKIIAEINVAAAKRDHNFLTSEMFATAAASARRALAQVAEVSL